MMDIPTRPDMNQERAKVAATSFVIETLVVREGRKLGKPEMNPEGRYLGIPIAVLGGTSRNRTYYIVDDFLKQLTDKDSYFRMMLEDGTLYGEYGHPDLSMYLLPNGQPDNNRICQRLMLVDEKNHSHHMNNVRVNKEPEKDGTKLIYADILPCGKWGPYLKESFESPLMNTSFSLRSIAVSNMVNDIIYRSMKKFITADAVTAGGYAQASKRFVGDVSNESIIVDFTYDMAHALVTEAACETFTNSDFKNIFGDVAVERHTITTTHLTGPRDLIDGANSAGDVYTKMMTWR